MTPQPPRVFLGLGANVGNRRENLRMALRYLAARGCAVVAVSSLYQSVAVVPEGAQPAPDYLNAVCEITTDLAPHDLLRVAKQIEHDIGRRPSPRWSARPIDIDILLYGDERIDTPNLTVPHPLLVVRNFVIAPLAELASDAIHPTLAKPIAQLAEDTDFAGLHHLERPEWAASAIPTT
jgi:2-amino-4-hydroxy-6-hydroxymethyldihydropteridine diphosphokinase